MRNIPKNLIKEEEFFPSLPFILKVPFSSAAFSLLKTVTCYFYLDLEYRLLAELKKFGINDPTLVDSGTSALFLALKSLNLKSDDEVIIPSFVCKSVANAVLANGAIPVFADIDEDFNISVKSIETVITSKTRVVIGVHQYGKMFDVDSIKILCDTKKIIFIEDSAIPIGIIHSNKFVGSFGDVGIYSFNIGKTLVGFGGGVLINCEKNFLLKKRKLTLSQIFSFLTAVHYKKLFNIPYSLAIKFGLLKREQNIIDLYEKTNKKNFEIRAYKMSRLQMAAVFYQIKNLSKILENHRKIANVYMKELTDIREIKLPDGHDNVFTLFPITTNYRYQLAEYLSKNGIETQWTFFPLHLQSKFSIYAKEKLENSEALWKKELSLPIGSKMKEDGTLYVCRKIKEFFNKTKND